MDKCVRGFPEKEPRPLTGSTWQLTGRIKFVFAANIRIFTVRY